MSRLELIGVLTRVENRLIRHGHVLEFHVQHPLQEKLLLHLEIKIAKGLLKMSLERCCMTRLLAPLRAPRTA